MAARPVALLLLVLVSGGLAASSSAGATQFKVGGQNGWSVPAAGAESYNTWAGRLRFQIGDQLLFVYPKETDSVLLVDAAAYNACNTSSYITRFDDGSTVFTLDRSGPFFFVSGNDASCRANEKLIVVVLADRSGTRTPPAAPPTSPPTPLPSPPSSPPAPATSPSSSPPSGSAAPVPAPAATPTSPPSPAASAPAPAPTTTAPSSPPAPAAQTPSPSTTPTPGGGSSSSPPSGSASAPGGDGGSGSTTTPPPPSAAAPVVAGFVGSLGALIGYAMLAA
ncbi:hypothetical protein BDA96_10G301300 [Sorghum bicolor]|uniref:Phytocyanin domain-containing protein n=2 Tax=Sorghum bicolor TaxID=4558 RepID=A0A921U2I7_SORBI|nr:early nodulin-like protein 2 [Sorghum bicolor]EER90231.1 hypothetical protein SORBI_3010G231900 [Sorghum bicolor]KAG0515694.1 hypothetical protein BDA96_10G301300 [Sorghum bicolor]|eukprot:XP_002438864.1 early nodulin-like protein 2 [Sorghum bicolor]